MPLRHPSGRCFRFRLTDWQLKRKNKYFFKSYLMQIELTMNMFKIRTRICVLAPYVEPSLSAVIDPCALKRWGCVTIFVLGLQVTETPCDGWVRSDPLKVPTPGPTQRSPDRSGPGSWALRRAARTSSGWWVCPGWRVQSPSSPPRLWGSRTCRVGAWRRRWRSEGSSYPIPSVEDRHDTQTLQVSSVPVSKHTTPNSKVW